MPPKRRGKKAAPKGKKKAPARKTRVDSDAESEIVKVIEKKKTGFLDLAAELRNEIYHLALVRKWEIELPHRKEAIELPTKTGEESPPVVIHEPALLATCRQVRPEALQVFYGANTFSVKYALYGVKLVKQLGRERTAMLTALKRCGTEQASLFEAAGSALKAVAVLVPIGHGASGGWEKLTESKDHRMLGKNEKMVRGMGGQAYQRCSKYL